MVKTIPKKEFLGQLMRLSSGILEALQRGDVAVASSLFDERVRYFEQFTPSDEPDDGLVDELLETDRRVTDLANALRGQLADSGRTLKRAKGYGDASLPPRPTGDWGSG